MPDALKTLLTKFANIILNPIILLGFIVSTIYIFYYVIQLIYRADDGSKLKENQKALGYGVLGLVIMFSVYGILRLIINTFGLQCDGIFFC